MRRDLLPLSTRAARSCGDARLHPHAAHRGVRSDALAREEQRQLWASQSRSDGGPQKEPADMLLEGSLPGAGLGSESWLAGYEAVGVLKDVLTADPEEPGATALEEARLRRLRQLAAMGVEAGAPTLRATLLAQVGQFLNYNIKPSCRTCSRTVKGVVDAILPHESFATPTPSQLSVRAAAEQFNVLVGIIQVLGYIPDSFAACLVWSMRAATVASRSREHLRLDILFRIIEADLAHGYHHGDDACDALFSLCNRALKRCGLQGGEDPDTLALAIRCLSKLSAHSNQDLEDVALDTCASILPDDGPIVDAWLVGHRERDCAAFEGKLPPAKTPGVLGGAARRRNDRALRRSQAGDACVWRKVIDMDHIEIRMRDAFAKSGGGVLGSAQPSRRSSPRERAVVNDSVKEQGQDTPRLEM